VFYEGGDLFSAYVNKWFTLRKKMEKEGKLLYAGFCKGMLNSLYGKFGQLNSRWIKIKEDAKIPDGFEEVYDYNTRDKKTYISLAGSVFIKIRNEEPVEGAVAVSSFITAYGRMLLWKLIKTAGREHCYYCDTDSLIVDKEGYERLKGFMVQDELGALKVEGSCSRVVFRNAKNYTFGSHEFMKGVKKEAKMINDGVYIQKEILELKTLLKRGIKEGAAVRDVIMTMGGKYNKGIVDENGTVKPFIIDDSTPKT
jgi:hypothetical protein